MKKAVRLLRWLEEREGRFPAPESVVVLDGRAYGVQGLRLRRLYDVVRSLFGAVVVMLIVVLIALAPVLLFDELGQLWDMLHVLFFL